MLDKEGEETVTVLHLFLYCLLYTSQPTETNYTCRATAASVKIDAQAYTADGTTVTVNGKQTDTVNLSSGKNTVQVKVSHTDGQSRTYQIQIERVSAVTVALEVPAGVDAEQMCIRDRVCPRGFYQANSLEALF